MKSIDLDRLDLVILARVNAPAKVAPSIGDLVRDIGSIASHLSKSELRERITERAAQLRERGLLDANRMRLTPDGEQHLAARLGIERATKWDTVKNRVLVAAGLGLDWSESRVQKALGDANKTRAAILQRHHQLPTAKTPTLNQAIDALVWRHLGVDTGEQLTLARLKAHILRQVLGAESRLNHEKLAWLAAAKATGASTSDIRQIRPVIARDWLGGGREEPAAEPPAPTPIEDLASFAARVKLAASAVAGSGRYGDSKVFISAAWRQLESNGGAPDLAAFKLRLLDANRAGLVRLHRADLVGAMDPDLVRASEIAHLNATFHFIECDRKGG